MTIDLDNPKLTAYILDELEPEEKAAFEEELKNDPEARRMVEEMHDTARLLEEELTKEPQPVLHPAQRQEITRKAARKAKTSIGWWRGFFSRPLPALATAACALVALGGVLYYAAPGMLNPWSGPGQDSQTIAMDDKRQSGNALYELAEPQRLISSKPVSGDTADSLQQPQSAAPASSNERQKAEVNLGQPAAAVESEADYSWHMAKGASPRKEKGSISNRQYGSFNRAAGVQFRREAAKLIDADGDMNFFYAQEPALVETEEEFNTEAYDAIIENPFKTARENPLSTFSIDVDTASYANMRRFLTQGQLPPPGSIRIEELVNYFTYDYPSPRGNKPFSVYPEVAQCPWAPEHLLVRIGLKGKEIDPGSRPKSNFVFLLDVSGSMNARNKLPLVKEGLKLLVNQLTPDDRVAMVVYAGASGLVLPSTEGTDKQAIIEALDRLNAGGSTNGGEGIELAYKTARENFIQGGVNRVILCTDGDFNVGATSQDRLTRLIEEKAKSGVFLSVLGFGMGNYKDSTLEKLADKGNGNYAYIDTEKEARKVLVEQMSGTLVTIAKDVKIQVEFNPARVEAYRLIGYENRMLAKEDFNDDTKDAGEIGAGHTVTALYEIIPAGKKADVPPVDELKYQVTVPLPDAAQSNELLTIKLRYKQPDGDTSRLLEFPLSAEDTRLEYATDDFKFASAVAAFGMLLRDSEHSGEATFEGIQNLAYSSKGKDRHGYRQEFVELVGRAMELTPAKE